MKLTITEVYADEGVWAESEAATYLISYPLEVYKLAESLGIPEGDYEDTLGRIKSYAGRTVDIEPGFITL